MSTAIVNNSLSGSNASYVNRVATFYNMRRKRASLPGRPYSPRRPWCESLRENGEWPPQLRSNSPSARQRPLPATEKKKRVGRTSKQLTLLVTSKFIDLGFFRRVPVDSFLRSANLPLVALKCPLQTFKNEISDRKQRRHNWRLRRAQLAALPRKPPSPVRFQLRQHHSRAYETCANNDPASNNELFLSDGAYNSELTDLVTGRRKKLAPKNGKNPYLQLDVTSDEMGEERLRSRHLRQSKYQGSTRSNNSRTTNSWLGPRTTSHAGKSHGKYYAAQCGQQSSDQQDTDIETRVPPRRRCIIPPKFPIKRFRSQNQKQIDAALGERAHSNPHESALEEDPAVMSDELSVVKSLGISNDHVDPSPHNRASPTLCAADTSFSAAHARHQPPRAKSTPRNKAALPPGADPDPDSASKLAHFTRACYAVRHNSTAAHKLQQPDGPILVSPPLGPLKTQKNSSYNRAPMDEIFTTGSCS